MQIKNIYVSAGSQVRVEVGSDCAHTPTTARRLLFHATNRKSRYEDERCFLPEISVGKDCTKHYCIASRKEETTLGVEAEDIFVKKDEAQDS